MDLFEYLDYNKILYNRISDILFEVDGKSYYHILPVDGKLFDNNFRISFEIEFNEYDYFVFNFGGIWYYTPTNNDEISLNKLKYLGKSIVDCFDTNNFLGVHGGYEILNGSGNYDDWCKKASFLGVKNLGICEKNTLAGIIKFQQSCEKYGIRAILGASYTVMIRSNGKKFDIKCFVKNELGWNNLLMLNKEVNVINHKFVYNDDFIKYNDGLVIVIDPKSLDYEDLLLYFDYGFEYFQLDTVIFDDEEQDSWYLKNLKKYTDNNKFKCVPITDAYYLDKEDFSVKSLLNQISGSFEYKSSNQYFKDKDYYFDELSLLLKDDVKFSYFINSLFSNEQKIIDECNNFNVKLGNRYLPEYKMTDKESSLYKDNEELFWGLIYDGFSKLNVDKDKYLDRIEKEVKVIQIGNIMDYFLMLHDIVMWCKNNDILVGIGRGSAGGSLISMLLGLINLDPIEFDLLFERFLNEGRVVKTLPDIDTDVEASKRDLVKQYMENRFGINQVISVGTYTALQIKSCIKDLGRVFGIPFSEVNYVTSRIDDNLKSIEDLFKVICKDSVVKQFANDNVDLINSISLIIGQPKAKSIHACAMVIYPDDKDMFSWAPVVLQDNSYVSEWEGPEMETVGFLKEDILGLQQLDKFKNIINLVKQRTGNDIDIYSVPLDDEKVYEYFCNGWNGDVFHFGSNGLTKYCKELKLENIEDLIAAISLFRPGAIENNFHNEYILRKEGNHDIEYWIGADEVLNNTYAVIVYQEQVMKLCQVLGGLSLVEADDVRKAMVKKKYDALHQYKDRFIDYYYINFKVSKEYATNVWDSIDKASSYLFNRSHAAAYAITGYICQWLKVHYPLEYWITGFEFMSEKDKNDGKVSVYISEIYKEGGINIYPVDINFSKDKISPYNDSIYWSISSIKQIGGIASESIINNRDSNGNYYSFEEFLLRNTYKGSKVNKTHIDNLIFSGAFDSIENIKNPCERFNLLKFFRESKKIKIEDSDIFNEAKEFIYDDWWWVLKQKKLSGIAIFDFEDLCDKYLKDKDYKWLDSKLLQDLPSDHQDYYGIGGVIINVIERQSKQKGKYCTLYLDSNSEFVWVNIFPDHYKALLNSGIEFVGSEGRLMLVTGLVRKDDFRKENVLKVWEYSELTMLGN